VFIRLAIASAAMARQPRVEIEGGLYHVITRGNNPQTIFHSADDYGKFLSLLRMQKSKLPFFLYAYCMMSNHVHLLIERQTDAIGRIMHRVLTGYSQYYNRRYQRVGHLLQGRHKSILCQSERYLAELVRYIHLNPVRANVVGKSQEYGKTTNCGQAFDSSILRLIDKILLTAATRLLDRGCNHRHSR
jgi:putative transposase